MKKKAKVRLDELIVELKLAPTKAIAQALIIAGGIETKTPINLKPGTLVDAGERVSLKRTNPYVSRGGLKLEAAMKVFGPLCKDKVCMDIGASTGGFTDYMLKHGAAKVYAVDVGKSLLDFKLTKDSRVVNIENVNFRYFSDQTLKEKIEFVTIDVSFISLDKVLPNAVDVLKPGGHIVSMVKPQFEVEPRELRKGVVFNAKSRLAAIERIKALSLNLGLEISGEADSEVKGPAGNVEYFLLMRKPNADQIAKISF